MYGATEVICRSCAAVSVAKTGGACVDVIVCILMCFRCCDVFYLIRLLTFCLFCLLSLPLSVQCTHCLFRQFVADCVIVLCVNNARYRYV